jgi:hypothetical protein
MGDVDLRTFTVKVRQFRTLSGVRYDYKMPILPIRSGGSLLSNSYAFFYDLAFYRPGKI